VSPKSLRKRVRSAVAAADLSRGREPEDGVDDANDNNDPTN
jgi:hypothetical protein